MNTLTVLTWASNPENLAMLVLVTGGLTLVTMRVWKLYLHFSKARSLRKLAEAHYKNGQYAKAEPLYQQILAQALREERLSQRRRECPDTVEAYH